MGPEPFLPMRCTAWIRGGGGVRFYHVPEFLSTSFPYRPEGLLARITLRPEAQRRARNRPEERTISPHLGVGAARISIVREKE